MGYSAQVQQTPNQTSGKVGSQQQINDATRKMVGDFTNGLQIQGMNGDVTNSATSGQPRIGQPNLYPNTVGMGDNTQQQPNQAQAKGKGA